MTEDHSFHCLREAAEYAKVSQAALSSAIRSNKLKAHKVEFIDTMGRRRKVWTLTKNNIDDYRAKKYMSDEREIEGKKVFDIESDRWSVLHAAKTLTHMLGRFITTSKIYYFIKTGEIRAKKYGRYWVISKDQIEKIYEMEKMDPKDQLTFQETVN